MQKLTIRGILKLILSVSFAEFLISFFSIVPLSSEWLVKTNYVLLSAILLIAIVFFVRNFALKDTRIKYLNVFGALLLLLFISLFVMTIWTFLKIEEELPLLLTAAVSSVVLFDYIMEREKKKLAD